MKKLVPVLFALSVMLVIQANAQISVVREDFPDIGTLVISATDNTTTIDPGQPGLNRTWDFSNLVASGYDSVYYINPTQAPGYQNYPSANIATKHNPLSYPNGFNVNFWDYSTTNIKGIADESLINLFGDFYIAFHIHYLPPSANLDFPIDYGDSKSQNFVIDWYTATRSGGLTTDTSRTVSHVALNCNADASGTMILPGGSFEVLRVKEVFNTTDSSFTWNGSSWVFDNTSTSMWTQYRWYAKNHGEVGFYGPGSKDTDGFTFFHSQTITGMSDFEALRNIAVFPNPATTFLNVSPSEQVSAIEVLDQAGNLLKQQSGESSVNVSDLPAGIYLVRIRCGKDVVTKKFCKK